MNIRAASLALVSILTGLGCGGGSNGDGGATDGASPGDSASPTDSALSNLVSMTGTFTTTDGVNATIVNGTRNEYSFPDNEINMAAESPPATITVASPAGAAIPIMTLDFVSNKITPGAPLAPGTYSSTSGIFCTRSLSFTLSVPGVALEAFSFRSCPGGDTSGSFTMTITSVSNVRGTGADQLGTPHGTLTAVMPQQCVLRPCGAATGTLTLTF